MYWAVKIETDAHPLKWCITFYDLVIRFANVVIQLFEIVFLLSQLNDWSQSFGSNKTQIVIDNKLLVKKNYSLKNQSAFAYSLESWWNSLDFLDAIQKDSFPVLLTVEFLDWLGVRLM